MSNETPVFRSTPNAKDVPGVLTLCRSEHEPQEMPKKSALLVRNLEIDLAGVSATKGICCHNKRRQENSILPGKELRLVLLVLYRAEGE